MVKRIELDKRNRNNVKLQMKQRIIHLKSELSRYKSKIRDYEENYHYKLLEELKVNNHDLQNNLKSKQVELDNTKEKLIDKEKKVQQLTVNLNQLTEEKNRSKVVLEEKIQLEKQLEQYKEEDDKRKKELSKYQEELNDLKEKLKVYEGELDTEEREKAKKKPNNDTIPSRKKSTWFYESVKHNTPQSHLLPKHPKKVNKIRSDTFILKNRKKRKRRKSNNDE
ncbi:hypothetical protein QA612_18755 [Evansella sp. AB-P1]|uniref:hypothetical protein n=1 Tax=Evansella sp. AB-P1 TaxID=3037653 RepID=UPI00241E838D|nr:hypothetical protein [Evansella sp. AB-P1]MDG5789503.1 hypothetical protein [Evansella sp. AB-P1]